MNPIDPANRYDGQYSGAALNSFLLGLGQSRALISRILKSHGLHSIEPDQWYDLEVARAIYKDIEQLIGKRMLFLVGKQMIETAPFPPNINDVPGVLNSLNGAYHMNVRGPRIGHISTIIDSPNSAVVTYETPFPCNLEQGITIGCCQKFGGQPSLRHVSSSCRDSGDPACEYRVTWETSRI